MFIFDNPIFPYTDNPPDPSTFLTVNPSSEPTFFNPFIPIQPTQTVHPSPELSHVFPFDHPPSSKDWTQAAAISDGPVLSQLPLSLDDLEWFPTPSSSKAAPAYSASDSPVPATLHRSDDASGFDQLSLVDEVCASAFNTPFAPYLDTPNQTPDQTPLFDCVASEDFDTTSLEQLWTAASSNVDAASSTAVQGLDLNMDYGLTSPPSPASTSLSGQNGAVSAQDPTLSSAYLQAETALLDFVLFDDIALQSPILTLSTPVTTSFSSPASVDLKACSQLYSSLHRFVHRMLFQGG
ncbi:hypothetical protein BC939DRAFT_178815 [Gamsiella multidivaricata]|uniref:uncharacterized protein n=1 Tax=Gamsiella multidivaricata TaxID=101098 RepID=UPI0022212A04|nr:uncharacterized protein BC939DRAFT_178815 [Gamsiella multidivaricata]KAI7822524.1 hypothetical protein BC939DRAFT_178815 [Gamsiella multidivaricata]